MQNLEIFLALIYLSMVGWNVYLMRQNAILTDKLMSRNFGDYITSKKFAEDEVKEEKLVEDPYDKQRAREINGMMGMG